MKALILASASPRRAQLLKYLVPEFEICSSDIDESPRENESPKALVERLAIAKAQHIATNRPDAVVLGSDTVVAMGDEILGKPRDKNHFLSMMTSLSKRKHQVYTGVCLIDRGKVLSEVVTSEVHFTAISSEDAELYWRSGEPKDKAGGYAIQGIGGQFVERVNGSVSAIIGLPMAETKQLLKRAEVLSVS